MSNITAFTAIVNSGHAKDAESALRFAVQAWQRKFQLAGETALVGFAETSNVLAPDVAERLRDKSAPKVDALRSYAFPFCATTDTFQTVKHERIRVRSVAELSTVQQSPQALTELAQMNVNVTIASATLTNKPWYPDAVTEVTAPAPTIRYSVLRPDNTPVGDSHATMEEATTAAERALSDGLFPFTTLSVGAFLFFPNSSSSSSSNRVATVTLPEQDDMYVDATVTRNVAKQSAAVTGWYVAFAVQGRP